MITDANIVNVLLTLMVLGECYHSNFLTCLIRWEFKMVSIYSSQFKLENAASEKSKCHRVSAKLVSIAFLKVKCGVFARFLFVLEYRLLMSILKLGQYKDPCTQP